ncbi:S9 family peptidase [Nonomuraea turcica]|uniref:S9 family peptidase n=1 Tax=Nonomuraea sp. G32 TaxID=3067274 RepID=UPI00273B2F34|nr:S9 family peptidase [Nonomuraea sp. G32]MDP4501323.1 S9 family peptidase [Nonomuraea sp. G32]
MRRLRLDDLWSFVIPSSPAIAPDGSRVVYVLRTAERDADRNRRALWAVGTEPGAPPVPLTTGWADTSPAWSPDGSRVAFLRGGDGPPQLYVVPAVGGEPERLTDLPLGAGSPRWSPDGGRIAFTAPVAATSPGGPIVIRRLRYKADGVGLRGSACRQLHVLDLGTGQVRQLTDGEWDAGEPAWSPDGTRLAYAAPTGADADLTLTSAAYVVGLAAGSPRLVGGAKGWVESVAWFPDGGALLAVGAPAVRIGHTRLLRLPLEGGEPVDLTAELDRNVMPGGPEWPGGTPQFTRDGQAVVFCARDRGSTRVYRVSVHGGRPEPVPLAPEVSVAGLSLARTTDVAAVVSATVGSHGEIALLDLDGGGVRDLTAHTRTALPDVEFIRPQEREFTISDGTVVHGWIVRDPTATGAGPLLLDAHGGPHLAWAPHLEPAHPYHQLLAAQGWTVLLLNPRASDGYGEDFYAASVGRWGIGDERDFLEPIDRLVAEGVADQDRLAVCGYSYGGFTTCHLTTRTGRFAAAVAGGPVTDLLSMAGSSDDAAVFAALEFGGDVYAGGDLLRAQSPIERVRHVSTPTLLVHAVNDDRCPVGQSEEWFTALRTLGVPTEMVLYPDESHQFLADGRPSNRVDYSRQIVRWVTAHVDGGGAG